MYSHPDQLTVFSKTDKIQIVATQFEAETIGGELGLSNKTSDYGYFTMEEVEGLDTLVNQKEAFIK